MTSWSYPFQPFEYWADIAESRPDFLIEGMLHLRVRLACKTGRLF